MHQNSSFCFNFPIIQFTFVSGKLIIYFTVYFFYFNYFFSFLVYYYFLNVCPHSCLYFCNIYHVIYLNKPVYSSVYLYFYYAFLLHYANKEAVTESQSLHIRVRLSHFKNQLMAFNFNFGAWHGKLFFNWAIYKILYLFLILTCSVLHIHHVKHTSECMLGV